MPKRIKRRFDPQPQKSPKIPDQIESNEKSPIWSFKLFDSQLELPNGSDTSSDFREICNHIKSYEGMTWNQILTRTDRDHFISVAKIKRFAQDRLQTIGLDEVETLVRFRFSGRNRLWGMKEGIIFRVLWWDPEHEICPSEKRHT